MAKSKSKKNDNTSPATSTSSPPNANAKHFDMPSLSTTTNPNIAAVFGPVPNREYHETFMRKAIDMAEFALASDETPVGCVFVHDGKIIGRGINGTNASLNGTRHAEFVALAEIMSRYPQSILKETDLYVTVEPCIMCASALRQYGIRAVYFGCLNDRFGGCGGVMTIHSDKAMDQPYPAYGGLFREEAIMLLRKFYVQENNKAPDPKPKKNRELKTAILPIGTPTSTPVNSFYPPAKDAVKIFPNQVVTPTESQTPAMPSPALPTAPEETDAPSAVPPPVRPAIRVALPLRPLPKPATSPTT